MFGLICTIQGFHCQKALGVHSQGRWFYSAAQGHMASEGDASVALQSGR